MTDMNREVGEGPASRRPWVLALSLVLVLLVGLGVALGLVTAHNSHQSDLDKARAQALTAARADFVQILSYDYKTLDADLAKSKPLTTGQFATYFDALISQEIEPNAPVQQTVTKATITPGGVVTATTTSADVLLFVDQSTTGKAYTAPKISTSTVQVTMNKVKGTWLVANVILIPASSGSAGSVPTPSTAPATSGTATAPPTTSAAQ